MDPNTSKNDAPPATDPGEPASPDWEAEISSAVETVMAEQEELEKPPADADAEKGEPVGEGGEEASDGDVKNEIEEKPPAKEPEGHSDEAIERAVRLGLSLSEIKQFSTEDHLNAMCARIEGLSAKDPGSQKGAGEGVDTAESHSGTVEDLLASLPDLDAEEYADYDPHMLSTFKNMAEALRGLASLTARQENTIKELSGSRNDDWIDAQLEGVKNFTKGDAAKAAAVKKKFGVLQAGYEAAGESVPRKDVFDEAAKLVLGSEMQAAKLQAKAKVARDRNGQFVARTSDRKVNPQGGDVDAEIADMVERKFARA